MYGPFLQIGHGILVLRSTLPCLAAALAAALVVLSCLALALAAADGLNTVQTYAFWSVHEPEPGVMRWGLADGDSRANVTSFLRKAADAGLFVSLRIGPFVCEFGHRFAVAKYSLGLWCLREPAQLQYMDSAS